MSSSSLPSHRTSASVSSTVSRPPVPSLSLPTAGSPSTPALQPKSKTSTAAANALERLRSDEKSSAANNYSLSPAKAVSHVRQRRGLHRYTKSSISPRVESGTPSSKARKNSTSDPSASVTQFVRASTWGLENIAYYSEKKDFEHLIVCPDEIKKTLLEVNKKIDTVKNHHMWYTAVNIAKFAYKWFNPLVKFFDLDTVASTAGFLGNYLAEEAPGWATYFLTGANGDASFNLGVEKEAQRHSLQKEYTKLGEAMLTDYRLSLAMPVVDNRADKSYIHASGQSVAVAPPLYTKASLEELANKINKHWDNFIEALQQPPLSLTREMAERTAGPLKHAVSILRSAENLDGEADTPMLKFYEDLLDKEAAEKAKTDRALRKQKEKALEDTAKIEKAEKDKKANDELLADLKKLRDDLTVLQQVDIAKRLVKITEDITNLTKDKVSKTEYSEKNESFNTDISNLQTSVKDLNGSQKEMVGRIEGIESKIKELIEQREKANEDFNGKITALSDRIHNLEQIKDKLLKAQEDLKAAVAANSTEAAQKLNEVNEKLKLLETRKTNLAEEIASLSRQHTSDMQKINADLDAAKKDKTEQLSALQKENKEALSKLETDLSTSMTQLKSKVTEENSDVTKRVNEALSQVLSHSNELRTLNKQMVETETRFKALEAAQESMQKQFDAAISALRKEIEANYAKKEDVETSIDATKRKIEEARLALTEASVAQKSVFEQKISNLNTGLEILNIAQENIEKALAANETSLLAAQQLVKDFMQRLTVFQQSSTNALDGMMDLLKDIHTITGNNETALSNHSAAIMREATEIEKLQKIVALLDRAIAQKPKAVVKIRSGTAATEPNSAASTPRKSKVQVPFKPASVNPQRK